MAVGYRMCSSSYTFFFFLNAHAESTFFSQKNQSANTNSPRHERSGICPRQRRTQTGGNSAVEKVEQGAE